MLHIISELPDTMNNETLCSAPTQKKAENELILI